jgi:myb proto-oncogene protein
MLKKAVEKCGGKNWQSIAAMVTNRTKRQCCDRWRNTLDPSTDLTAGHHGGEWTVDEDNKLKEAVKRHGSKNWQSIAAMVPGRSRAQCWNRWHRGNRMIGYTGKSKPDEDSKLQDIVQTHGDKMGRN